MTVTRPIVPVTIHAKGQSHSTYALLDTGANICAIDKDIVTKLDMDIDRLKLNLRRFDDEVEIAEKEVTSFTISDLNETINLPIKNALISLRLTAGNEIPPRNKMIENLDYMNDVKIQELEHDEIGMILSSKYAQHYMGKEMRTQKNDENESLINSQNLIAVKTDFGWCVIGPRGDDDVLIDAEIDAINNEPELTVEKMIQRMYRHDFICRPDEEFPSEIVHISQNDRYSLDQIKDSISYDEQTGHYSAALPWKLGREKTAKIFENVNFYEYAKNRQEKLKIKLEKDPTMKEKAFKQMKELVEHGWAVEIPDHTSPIGSPVCYLANHLVTHPDKPGKVRICQDAAGKVKGHSLNKYLNNGPDLLNDLLGILLRFRRKKIVLSADIKSFYYQVQLDKKDRPATRFLW